MTPRHVEVARHMAMSNVGTADLIQSIYILACDAESQNTLFDALRLRRDQMARTDNPFDRQAFHHCLFAALRTKRRDFILRDMPTDLVPEFIDILKESSIYHISIISYLGKMGSKAKDALPILEQISYGRNHQRARLAIIAMNKIAGG